MQWFAIGIDPLVRYLERRLQGILISSLPVLRTAFQGETMPLPPLQEHSAIISTDRTKAQRDFMKPLEDAEAVELDEENDDEDSEFEDNYYEDSDSCDSSDEVDAQNELLWRMMQQKVNSQVKTRMLHKV